MEKVRIFSAMSSCMSIEVCSISGTIAGYVVDSMNAHRCVARICGISSGTRTQYEASANIFSGYQASHSGGKKQDTGVDGTGLEDDAMS